MGNPNRSNNNATNQDNEDNDNQNNSVVPIPTTQDLQLFLSCLHQVAVAQITQWHDSLQATFSARGVGSTSNNNSSNRNRSNNIFLQQNNSSKTKTSSRPTNTKKNKREDSSDSSSTSEGESESEDLIWVDGEKEFEVPTKQLKKKGKPYFGWTFCHVNSYKTKAFTKDNLYCMGCMKCPIDNCTFVARPSWPQKKGMGAPPKPAKIQCPIHNANLEWIPCTGNLPVTTPNGQPMPCTLKVTIHNTTTPKVTAIHLGSHASHPRPPLYKASPAAMKAFTKIVKINPEAGPAKLMMGTPTRPSVLGLSNAFSNIDRVGNQRRQTLQSTMRALGIRGSLGSLFEFSADIPTEFIVECSFKEGIISLQSDYMRQVLNDAAGGLQSDTVEGVINELEYTKGSVDIHFISAFDQHQDRWVPVLMSIIFGRKAGVFSAHWMTLLKSYDDVKTWEEFEAIFPGITIDWSSALGKAFCETLIEFALNELGGKVLELKDTCSNALR